MRFDLEYITVGNLTSKGLSTLSDTLYGDSISPMLWDTKYAPSILNRGVIDTSKFSDFSRGLNSYFISGIPTESTLSFDSIIRKDGQITLLFNGGDFLAYRKNVSWSNNSISKLIYFDENYGYYMQEVDDDIDISSISVYTMSAIEGTLQTKKEFSYIKYDNVSVDSTFKGADKKLDYLFTITDGYVYLNQKEIRYNQLLGVYESGNAIFALPEFPSTDLVVDGLSGYKIESGNIIFNNYTEDKIKAGTEVVVSYAVTPILTYKQTSRSTKDDIVFKNANTSPRALSFKSGTLGLYNCFGNSIIPNSITFGKNIKAEIGYKESPKVTAILRGVDSIPIQTTSLTGNGVTLNIISNNAEWQETGTPRFSSDTGFDGSISATLSIDKEHIGIYVQKEWVENVTLDGVQRGRISLPFPLQLLGDAEGNYTADDLKKIYTYIIYDNDPILGKISSLAGEIPLVEYVTYKSDGTETGNKIQEKTLESYYVNGRKVAYVKLLQNNSNILTSSFIKPISIEKVQNKDFLYRDLFIKSNKVTVKVRGTDGNTYSCIKWHKSNDINRPVSGEDWQLYWKEDSSYMPIVNWEDNKNYFPSQQYIGTASSQIQGSELVSSDANVVTNGVYEDGILPYNTLSIMSSTAPEATVITYNDPFVVDPDVIGYWIVTDRKIQIKAEYNDEYLKIESDTLEINMKSLESETAFTITGFETNGVSTTLSEFGYISISDYIKSPFKLNSCSFYCTNSDAVNKQCIHKNKAYRKNFILDDGGIGCARTDAYESTHTEAGHCPGLNAKLINPFILPVLP